MTRWTLDPMHTEIGFAVRHMMVSTVKGRFRQFDLEIDVDEQHPENSSLLLTVDAASLDTGVDDRDQHLRAPDFFDVERFATISFRSTRIRRAGDGELKLTGDLTIRDVTREILLTGEFAGPLLDPQGNRRIGVSLSGELDREAFGLTWNTALDTGGVLVGKTVKISVEAEVVEQQTQVDAEMKTAATT